MARKLALGILLSLSLMLASCKQSPAQKDSFPITRVQLQGTPQQIGSQHAQQLAPTIHMLLTQYLGKYLNQNSAMRWTAMLASSAFEGELRPEHRAELQALAGGTKIDERMVMLGQCFLDMVPLTACSTISVPADASPDGIGRFARNLDFPSFDIADKHSAVFIYRPVGRYQFVAIGWPGMIGVLSGMNEHGLALANMEVKRTGRMPSAMPYTLLYRTILEQCRNVDEAIALLQNTPRQSANNLMLMDAQGNRAVAEITQEKVVIRRGLPHKALISTNHQRGSDQDTPGRCTRYDALHSSSAETFGQIDEKALEKMLGQASSIHGHTLQSMVFEPTTRVIYLSAGQDAAHHPFWRLDLKKYFH